MIGKIPQQVLEAVLETLPIEFSVLDANDNVFAWNKQATRIFKRLEAVVGRNVRSCHPQKNLAKVEQIISEMKAKKRDKARFWINLGRFKVLIDYFALRDQSGKYLGCLEVTQDITELQKLSGGKRLLD